MVMDKEKENMLIHIEENKMVTMKKKFIHHQEPMEELEEEIVPI